MPNSVCPNCGSDYTVDYLHEDTREYAFTICNDCDEEFGDESKEDWDDD